MIQNDSVFDSISRELGACVTVIDREGRLIYMNAEAIRMFVEEGADAGDFVGKKLSEFGYPDEWVSERLGLIARVLDQGDECVLRSIWNGHQQFSWVRSLGSEDGEIGRVLFITRRVEAGSEAKHLVQSEMEVVQSNFVGLGELSVLSKRELEVLALIGQGLMAREIASLLHRSVKTIENHRVSIGIKLAKSNKVELALMARAAGLMIDDAFRGRVDEAVPTGV